MSAITVSLNFDRCIAAGMTVRPPGYLVIAPETDSVRVDTTVRHGEYYVPIDTVNWEFTRAATKHPKGGQT